MRKVCFFGHIANKPDFETFFCELAEDGKRNGFEVTGLNIGRPLKGPSAFPMTHLPFPTNPSFYGWMARRAEDTPENRTWTAIAEFEPKSIENFGLPTVNAVLANLYAYLINYFSRLKPDIVILGHQFAAPYQVALHVCSELGIPVLFNHPGVLNGTMCFEGAGQMAESELFRRWDKITSEEVSSELLLTSRTFIEHLRAGFITRPGKANTTANSELEKVEALGGSGCVLLYAGIADYRTGVQPRSYPKSSLHSGWVDSSVDGLKYLVELSGKLDFKIIYKAHPIEAETYDECFNHPNVLVVKDITINRLLDHCHAFSTICSSSAYEAVLKGVPTLLLGRMQASLCPVVCSADSIGDVADFIERVKDRGIEISEDDVVRHVAYLLRDYLFVSDPVLKDLPLRLLSDFWSSIDKVAQVPQLDGRRKRQSAVQKPGPLMYLKRLVMMLRDIRSYGISPALVEFKEEGRFLLNC
jgi:hypothetical protein